MPESGHIAEDGGIIINYKFYKWMMIIDLAAIGVLRFSAGTFFDYTVAIRIADGVLYILAIAFTVIYLQKRLGISNTRK